MNWNIRTLNQILANRPRRGEGAFILEFVPEFESFSLGIIWAELSFL